MPGDNPLKHNPFASLRNLPAARPPTAAKQQPLAPAKQQALARLLVREESDAETGGLIARVIGVPQERARALGAAMRSAIGGSVFVEGRELVVTPNDCERVAAWLREQGASEVVIVKRPRSRDLQQAGRPGGTVRAEIRRGLHVAIVMKADQDTGTLTEGVVRELLTSSPMHPRGIKVRLESGQVGRVRRILEPAQKEND